MSNPIYKNLPPLLVYRTHVNGLSIDADTHEMWCIYVPKHEKVIAMAAGGSLVVTSMETDTKTMSIYKAIDTAVSLLELNSSDDIVVTKIEIVYTMEDSEESFTKVQTLNQSIGPKVQKNRIVDGNKTWYSKRENAH